MAKLVIPRESFGDINVYTEQYQIRYRIVSDDKNIISYWSPTYSLDPKLYCIPGKVYSPGRLTLTKVGTSTSVSLSWDSVSIRKSIQDNSIEDPYVNLSVNTASFNSTTGLITYNVNNNLVAGQRISIYGCADYRFNFENGTINTRTNTQLTFQPATTTLTNGSTTSGGKLIGYSQSVGELPDYDVWVRWSGAAGANASPWIYKDRIATTSVVVNIPTSYVDVGGTVRNTVSNIDVEVYRPATPAIRNNTGKFLMYSGTLAL